MPSRFVYESIEIVEPSMSEPQQQRRGHPVLVVRSGCPHVTPEVAARTVRRDVAAVKAVFNAAVDADVIARSPARKLALPRASSTHRATLTPAELIRLADSVEPRYRALILVGGVLGLRWGEAVALRVRDIDFMRRSVTVSQTVEEIAGQIRVVPGHSKSVGSLRTVTAPTFLIEELASHLRLFRGGDAGDRDALVFVGPHGGILRRRFAEREFKPRSSAPASIHPSRSMGSATSR